MVWRSQYNKILWKSSTPGRRSCNGWFSHDSYHAGELSQTLGIHGLTQIDLWRST